MQKLILSLVLYHTWIIDEWMAGNDFWCICCVCLDNCCFSWFPFNLWVMISSYLILNAINLMRIFQTLSSYSNYITEFTSVKPDYSKILIVTLTWIYLSWGNKISSTGEAIIVPGPNTAMIWCCCQYRAFE